VAAAVSEEVAWVCVWLISSGMFTLSQCAPMLSSWRKIVHKRL
jgi:hypothetical protein